MNDSKTYEEIVASFDEWEKTLKELLEAAEEHDKNVDRDGGGILLEKQTWFVLIMLAIAVYIGDLTLMAGNGRAMRFLMASLMP